VQRVLASIDTYRVGNGDCLAGHGRALLVLFENPYKLCEPLGAGARPVHPIRVIALRCNNLSAFGATRTQFAGASKLLHVGRRGQF